MSRIFAVPDIHGRADLLDALMFQLWEHEGLDLSEDKIVFLGDMIDRGPDSRSVLEHIQGLCLENPGHVIALCGNHENLCLDAYRDCEGKIRRQRESDKWMLWLWNGGGSTLRSYYPLNEVTGFDREWMAGLPLYHEEPGFFFSHAPVPRENRRSIITKGHPFTEHELTWSYSPDEIGWSRDFSKEPMPGREASPTVGVCGHIHALRRGLKEPRFYEHYIFADAGCGCHDEAPLVAIDVKTRDCIYAESRIIA